jgi:membrane associated rhomboid family serine protease
MFPPLTDVVKNLIIINVLMFIGTAIAGEEIQNMLAVYYPMSDNFRPFQIVTHMFMHSNITGAHIFFNMLGLYMFGVPLEQRFGPQNFLFYYLSAGLGALILYFLSIYIQIQLEIPVNINSSAVGASGAIFGLLLGYGVLFADRTINLIFPPIAIKGKYFVLIFGAIELFMGFSGKDTGVAHFAHIGGAITGFLILVKWGLLRR